MSSSWQVHVIGPDDLLPAASMLDAMRMSAAINQTTVTNLAKGYTDTYLWAVPVPPGNTAALVVKQ